MVSQQTGGSLSHLRTLYLHHFLYSKRTSYLALDVTLACLAPLRCCNFCSGPGVKGTPHGSQENISKRAACLAPCRWWGRSFDDTCMPHFSHTSINGWFRIFWHLSRCKIVCSHSHERQWKHESFETLTSITSLTRLIKCDERWNQIYILQSIQIDFERFEYGAYMRWDKRQQNVSNTGFTWTWQAICRWGKLRTARCPSIPILSLQCQLQTLHDSNPSLLSAAAHACCCRFVCKSFCCCSPAILDVIGGRYAAEAAAVAGVLIVAAIWYSNCSWR